MHQNNLGNIGVCGRMINFIYNQLKDRSTKIKIGSQRKNTNWSSLEWSISLLVIQHSHWLYPRQFNKGYWSLTICRRACGMELRFRREIVGWSIVGFCGVCGVLLHIRFTSGGECAPAPIAGSLWPNPNYSFIHSWKFKIKCKIEWRKDT